MGHYINQHFVPQFFLRRFSGRSDRSIGLFLTEQERFVFRASIRDQCSKPHFYMTKGGLEKVLNEGVEAPAANAIARITNDPWAFKFRSQDYHVLLRFVRVQSVRTMRAFSEQEDWMKVIQSRRGLPTWDDSNISSLGNTEPQAAKFFRMLYAVFTYPILIDLFPIIITNNTSKEFIVSDNPVVLCNSAATSNNCTGNVIGFAASGLQIVLPLSPTVAIVLYDRLCYRRRKLAAQVVSALEEDMDELNFAQADSAGYCIYFSGSGGRDWIKSNASEIASRRDSVKRRNAQSIEVLSESEESTVISLRRPIGTPMLRLSFLRERRHHRMRKTRQTVNRNLK
jgi:hypothetical protein